MQNEEWIESELKAFVERGEYRTLKTIDKSNGEILNFSSNDYLNFSENIDIINSSIEATKNFGTGSKSSRLVTGTTPLHTILEKKLAEFKGYPATLTFGSGFLANMGIIPTLLSRNDIVIVDRISHASIMDAAIKSRAKLIRFNHNDTTHLSEILEKYKSFSGKKLVVTESVFSMDGDIAPIKKISEICEKFDSMLMVDEAHSTGVFGKHGEGVVHELGLSKKVNISMGTFSKALGSYGGFICCSEQMKKYLINRSRTFIYSTSLPPAVVAAQIGAIDFLKNEKNLGSKLLDRAERFRGILKNAGLNTKDSKTQIIPIIIGDSKDCIEFSKRLLENDILAVAIRPPTVSVGAARIRFSVTLAHSEKILDDSAEKIVSIAKEMGII